MSQLINCLVIINHNLNKVNLVFSIVQLYM